MRPNTFCEYINGRSEESRNALKFLIKYVLRNSRPKQELLDRSIDPISSMVGDYCFNKKDKALCRVSGTGIFIGLDYYSFIRDRVPGKITDAVVDYFFESVEKTGQDVCINNNFKELVCNFVKIKGYESWYRAEEELTKFIDRHVEIHRRKQGIQETDSVADSCK